MNNIVASVLFVVMLVFFVVLICVFCSDNGFFTKKEKYVPMELWRDMVEELGKLRTLLEEAGIVEYKSYDQGTVKHNLDSIIKAAGITKIVVEVRKGSQWQYLKRGNYESGNALPVRKKN